MEYFFITLPPSAIIQVTGLDAALYLQGRLTQDIFGLKLSQGLRSLILTPQGRVQAQLIVVKTKESFILISDPISSFFTEADFLSALLQFKVADQLETKSLSSDFCLFLFVSNDLIRYCEEPIIAKEWGDAIIQAGDLKRLSNSPGLPRRCAPRNDEWADQSFVVTTTLGEVVMVPVSKEEQFKKIYQVTENYELLDYFRISKGIPLYGVDITEKTLAQELDLTELVSFSKGCYTGQEVVEMATARGRANKKLRLFSAQASNPIVANTEIKDSSGADCGFITSSCLVPQTKECLCLGYLKTSIEDSTPLFVADKSLRIIK